MDRTTESNGVPSSRQPHTSAAHQLPLFDNGDGDFHHLAERLNQQSLQLDRVESLLSELVEKSRSPQLPEKMAYTPKEFAKLVGLEPETVQGHLREGRIEGFKTHAGRGREREWRISREEFVRFQNEGLLPPRQRYRQPR